MDPIVILIIAIIVGGIIFKFAFNALVNKVYDGVRNGYVRQKNAGRQPQQPSRLADSYNQPAYRDK